ncbi:MAG: endonuclease V [Thermoplasmata archaeon]|nr:endonuclease V [Thermoplasmata archaeon]
MRFSQEVEHLLSQVPPGRVTTFRALAVALGDPRAAIAVYRHLARERTSGWHRVVRVDGSVPSEEAIPRLESEGVEVQGDAVSDIARFLLQAFRSDRPLARLREEQRRLAERIEMEDRLEGPTTVAGFDVSYRKSQAYGVAVLLDWETRKVLDTVRVQRAVDFPYISTYLAYREFDVIERCYDRFKERPSLLLIDGNGTLHPERFGVACYVGLRLDRPTVGVAKSLLLGRPDRETLEPGASCPVRVDGETAGHALRTGKGKPVYVSPGHRVSLETALRFVRHLARTRIPEPLRLADREAARFRREKTG